MRPVVGGLTRATRRALGFDRPVSLADVESTVSDLLMLDDGRPVADASVTLELRGFQLCIKQTERAAYVVLPTGCGAR